VGLRTAEVCPLWVKVGRGGRNDGYTSWNKGEGGGKRCVG
jgi:hypothetical protein